MFAVGALLIGLFSAGFSSAQTDERDVETKKLAVMPFLKGRYQLKWEETADARLSRLSFDAVNVLDQADQTLTRIVQEELRSRYGERVIAFREALAAYDRMAREQDDTPRNLARRFGHALGADAVLVGTVWRYRNRAFRMSDDSYSPSAVGFALFFINVSDGKRLWSAAFDETQKTLFENLLEARTFFKKGGKWLTADELARYGAKELLKKMP
jgi:hypothetical protein